MRSHWRMWRSNSLTPRIKRFRSFQGKACTLGMPWSTLGRSLRFGGGRDSWKTRRDSKRWEPRLTRSIPISAKDTTNSSRYAILPDSPRLSPRQYARFVSRLIFTKGIWQVLAVSLLRLLGTRLMSTGGHLIWWSVRLSGKEMLAGPGRPRGAGRGAEKKTQSTLNSPEPRS